MKIWNISSDSLSNFMYPNKNNTQFINWDTFTKVVLLIYIFQKIWWNLIWIISSVLAYTLHFCRHALINCCHCSESATKRPIELLKIANCGLCLGIYLQIMFAFISTCLLHSTFTDNYIFLWLYYYYLSTKMCRKF